MRKISSYIPSLILSVILVFSILSSAAAILAVINFNADKYIKIAERNSFADGVYTELEKEFKEKYNITGIPSDVYMNSISESYLEGIIENTISSAFDALNSGSKMQAVQLENKKLEEDIDKFFSDYADSVGYKKDEAYSKKVESTKQNVYKTISAYCDVYKFSALSEHGVLSKLSRLYKVRIQLTAVLSAITVTICLLLVLINRKNKFTALYWTGTSSVAASLVGLIPSIYLVSTKYFDSFSIKQAQVFTAYTSLMYKYTKAFSAVNTAVLLAGITMYIIYNVLYKKYYQKSSD